MTNPGLSGALLLDLFAFMSLTRRFEDRLERLVRQGRLQGTLMRSLGQEATAVGAAFALEPGDLLAPGLRSVGALLTRGVSPAELFLQFLGRQAAPCGGRDGQVHLCDPRRGLIGSITVLGAQIPVMTGAILGARMRGEPAVGLTFIGDGGVSTGDFHEGTNLAAVLRLPLVLVIENNGYAFSTPPRRQSALSDLALRAHAYGIRWEIVDGNDVLAVVGTVRRAVASARRGGGPVLVEAKTFRMSGHAAHDDASYVSAAERRAWAARDPLVRYTRWLLSVGVAGPAELKAIGSRLERLLEQDEQAALAAPGPPAGAREEEGAVYSPLSTPEGGAATA